MSTKGTVAEYRICPKFLNLGNFSRNYFANIYNIISIISKKIPQDLEIYAQKSIRQQSPKYFVKIEKYVERHFIKSFKKKYKRAWDITMDALIREFQSFDVLLERTIAEMITTSLNVKICKVEFKIAGTNKSRHSSGNRGIVAIHKDKNIVNVLLLYHKNDLGGGNETARWKQLIKENYPDYRNLV